jgi:hypothetical protein
MKIPQEIRNTLLNALEREAVNAEDNLARYNVQARKWANHGIKEDPQSRRNREHWDNEATQIRKAIDWIERETTP